MYYTHYNVDAFGMHQLQYDMRYPLGTVQKSGCVGNPYLRFDQDCWISLDRVGQPALQAFGKVTNCLCEGARNGTQYFRDEEVHNALIEHVVACTEVLHHRFTSSQKDQFVFWDLFHFIVNWLLDFTGTKHGHSIKLNSRCEMSIDKMPVRAYGRVLHAKWCVNLVKLKMR